MAKAITQRISLEGTDELRRQFAELGRAIEQAFRQIGDQIAKVGEIKLPTDQAKKNLAELSTASEKTFKDIESAAKKTDVTIPSVDQNKRQFTELAQVGKQSFNEIETAAAATRIETPGIENAKTGFKDLANVAKAAFGDISAAANVAKNQIDNLTGGFSGLQKALLGLGAVGTVLGFIVNSARNAANAVNEIGDAAGQAKVSINVYRQLDFMLQSLGFSAEQSKKMLEEFGNAVSVAGAKITTFGTRAGHPGILELGGQVQELRRGMIVIDEASTKANANLVEFQKNAAATAEALAKVRAAGQQVLLARGSEIDADLPQRLIEFTKALDLISDKQLRIAEASRIFGQVFGKEFVDKLGAGGVQLFLTALKAEDALDLFRKWALDLGSGAEEAAKRYKGAIEQMDVALLRFRFAQQAGTIESGIVFTPFLTAVIEEATVQLGNLTNFLRANRGEIAQWAADFGKSVVRVAADVFKILSGIPAALKAVFSGLGANLGGVSGEKIAAGITAAAIAVTALTVAFKGLGVVMTPVTALFSLFSGFGPILLGLGALAAVFWDQIKEGVGAAFEEGSSVFTGLRHAMEDLFKGDLIGFWRNFSNAAVLAFEIIVDKFTQMQGAIGDIFRGFQGQRIETPWVAALFEAFKQIKEQLPEIILGITAVVLLFARFPKFTAFTFGLGFFADGLRAIAAAATIAGFVLGGLALVLGAIPVAVGLATAAIFEWIRQMEGVPTWVKAAAVALTLFAAFLVSWPALIIAAVAALFVFRDAIIQIAKDLIQFFEQLPVWAKIALAAIAAIVVALLGWPVALAAIAAIVVSFWQDIKAGATDVANWVKETWNDIISYIGTKIEEGKKLIKDWVTTPVAGAWDWLKSSFLNALAEIDNLAKRFGKERFFPDGGGAAPPGGATGGQFARGGLLGGRGTGTSDSNLAWVSRGEYIIPARAVRQPGVLALLEALRRSGGNLLSVLAGIRGYAGGGLAGYADGGSVDGGITIIAGSVFNPLKDFVRAVDAFNGASRAWVGGTRENLTQQQILQRDMQQTAEANRAAMEAARDAGGGRGGQGNRIAGGLAMIKEFFQELLPFFDQLALPAIDISAGGPMGVWGAWQDWADLMNTLLQKTVAPIRGVGSAFERGGPFGPRADAGAQMQTQFADFNRGVGSITNTIAVASEGLTGFDTGLTQLASNVSETSTAFSTSSDGLDSLFDGLNEFNQNLTQFASLDRGGGGATFAAAGGLLGGRGTGTSDSNLAWVSRGEYITPARAVRQPGVLAFLEALRQSGGNLRRILDGMGRYALGGLVMPSAIPAMAGGGSMHPVTINFAGTTVSGLRAPADVVEQLRQAAVLAQVRSGGRKPSRYS